MRSEARAAGALGMLRHSFSPSLASPHGVLLPQAQFGGFGQAAFQRATIQPDVAKLTVVETAEQYEAGLAGALLAPFVMRHEVKHV